MLFTKVRKLVVLLSGAAAVALISGCGTAVTTTPRVSYLDQKEHLHYVPQFAAEQQNAAPYALTGQTTKPQTVKLYNQKGHAYYVTQWPTAAN